MKKKESLRGNCKLPLKYLEEWLSILHLADNNVSSCHLALTTGDAKADPPSCLGFNCERNFFLCRVDIPVQLHFLAFIQSGREGMSRCKINGRGLCRRTHEDQQEASQNLHDPFKVISFQQLWPPLSYKQV